MPCRRMMAAGVGKRGYILKVTSGFADDLDVLCERNRQGKGELKGLARAPQNRGGHWLNKVGMVSVQVRLGEKWKVHFFDV